MRKSRFAWGMRILSILLLCSTGAIQALVVWTSGVTPDVTDDNLDLGASTIVLQGPGPVRVSALTTNVAVNMPIGDVVIQGQAGGGSALYFNAALGQTISVNLSNNLTFQGSAGGAVPDLLLVIEGLGDVVFVLDGGKSLTLNRNGIGGAVQMYVLMSLPSGTDVPTLVIDRDATLDPAPNANVEFLITDGSILSYLSTEVQPSSSQEGEIIFYGNNPNGTGRMVLTIGDASAVIVRGRLLDPAAPADFQLSDIDPATPAGFFANMIVRNTTPATMGSLLVQNYNNTIGEFIWDPWFNLGVRDNPPFGTFSGQQYGFIIGSYGALNVESNAYFDYVGLTGVQCVTPAIPGVDPSLVSSMVKARSGSALFTDAQPDDSFVAPLINIDATAGIYFRSGVDNEGNVNLTPGSEYTIDPANRTPGAGFPVFDIEGVVTIIGANTDTQELSLFQLLSLEVNPTGGPLFDDGSETIFPLRTFATNSVTDACSGETTTSYVSYNNACFLNNGRANLFNVSWEHTDQNHIVLEKNDILSEPAYIGGETWSIANKQTPQYCMPLPIWAFVNSRFNIHTSVALTGLILLVPNGSLTDGTCIDNASFFTFYQNGYAIDNGTGRQLNLGTYIGSTACDGCTVISKDADLDVMQTQECVGAPPVDSCDPIQGPLQLLTFRTDVNTSVYVENIPAPGVIANQYSIHTIYLGNNSNISIGTNGSVGTSMDPNLQTQVTFPLTTCPELLICGNFFSFESRGGQAGLPETSNVTGQGGIFVDMNGVLSICQTPCAFLANMNVMVTKSHNGIVDLPKNQVFFDPRVGIANWNIDLSDPTQVVIIPEGTTVSDYTLNWQFTKKDYDTFTPYIIDCINTCTAQEVIAMNVVSIPTIEGTVEQLQIAGTRLGDPAHILIDGGIVEELVFLRGYTSGSAPVAVVVLQGNGTVGLGTAHRNIDSTLAEFTLGANGVNLILNSANAEVVINEDMIINNVCAILPGPDIADQTARLVFTSDCCKTLRVTKDGTLDLRAFTTGQVIEFSGNLNVVFEPGARVILGDGRDVGVGPTLRWSEEAICSFSPIFNTNALFEGSTLQNTDPVRVIFTGIGNLEFANGSRGELFRDAFVGVESLPECGIFGAAINLNIIDSAQFLIGSVDAQIEGGALQIGNVTDYLAPVVTFNLFLNGPDATFEIGPQGFFGAGVGIVEKGHEGHDLWRVAPTANLSSVFFDLQNGRFRHPQVYAGSDVRSALFALSNSINGATSAGQGIVFSLNAPNLFGNPVTGTLLSNMSILGGGNFISALTTAGTFFPVVDSQSGSLGNYTAGILASRPLIATNTFSTEDAAVAFDFMRLQDIRGTLPATNRGVAAPSYERNEIRIAYLDSFGIGPDGLFSRQDWNFVQGQATQIVLQDSAIQLGAVGIILQNAGIAPRAVVSVKSIGS